LTKDTEAYKFLEAGIINGDIDNSDTPKYIYDNNPVLHDYPDDNVRSLLGKLRGKHNKNVQVDGVAKGGNGLGGVTPIGVLKKMHPSMFGINGPATIGLDGKPAAVETGLVTPAAGLKPPPPVGGVVAAAPAPAATANVESGCIEQEWKPIYQLFPIATSFDQERKLLTLHVDLPSGVKLMSQLKITLPGEAGKEITEIVIKYNVSKAMSDPRALSAPAGPEGPKHHNSILFGIGQGLEAQHSTGDHREMVGVFKCELPFPVDKFLRLVKIATVSGVTTLYVEMQAAAIKKRFSVVGEDDRNYDEFL